MSNIAIPETTTALILNAFNEPLALEKTPTPKTTPAGSVLVRVLSTSVRPHNRAGFTGQSPLSQSVPYNPGNSGVGRVIAVGPDAVAVKPGQLVYLNGFYLARDDPEGTRVLTGLHSGVGDPSQAKLFKQLGGLWRDVATVPLENAIPLNEALLVDEMGYSFGDINYIQRLSVAYGGVSAAELRAGETVIVAPATGHFSGAVAEIAAQIGCKVIALSRSASKLEPLASRLPRIAALELSGDEKRDVEAIRALAPGGADAYIDVSPPAATASPHRLAASLASLRPFGRAVLLGMMFDVTVNYMSLMARNITVKGQHMYTRAELVSLVKMVEAGVLKLGKDAGHEVVGRGFSLEEWEEAVTVAEKATG
ncbi:zinc-binding dehydrogenase [Colletotrichum graminicola]|uniref:Zinc-binding dehydrogenase n=1 Tax=Colletotrichum graminicola (strain M1.001 / M2 / FGSC 10212) TaxID=645133 RepID=E3QNN9_COLGM|nr:zinc-binding dehydrogenase [Colletotrichum graminicola M1.001]EFQ32526.1 zinc-binding dehydrogenase [Colletotrichum graminicola M1.001]WDK14681.1 zinc-binding dehydrogenase [Colletotrichum graminicola]